MPRPFPSPSSAARAAACALVLCLGAGGCTSAESPSAFADSAGETAESDGETAGSEAETAGLDSPPLPAELVLRIDQVHELAAGEVRIVLLEILRDSRCPVDVTCVWAGEAEVSIGLRAGDAAETVSVGTADGSGSPRGEALGYAVELLEVAPQPVSTEILDEEDYRIRVRIERVEAM